MGLISAALSSAGSVLADQWKEFFYCEAIPGDVLALRGKKRTSGGNRGGDNIISNGSVIAVADGQCMLIVEQGKIVDLCAEPGEYIYDISSEPSVFAGGDLADNILDVFAAIGKRFTFGGDAPKEQRVYYFNTREILGNKYGTPSPVPFRVVDAHANIDMDIAVRCFGEYSYRIVNPLLFYTNVCGNIEQPFTRAMLDGQLKSELLTALQPAFGRISEMGIRYSSLPAHALEMAAALNEVLSPKWREHRGIEIVLCGVSSVKASEEDERLIKELQRTAALKDPDMRAAHYVNAAAAAIQSAAANESAGPAMAFMGMNMAQNAAGVNTAGLFQSGAAPRDEWICPSCGAKAAGKFCAECGTKRPDGAAATSWTCPSCGAANKGKFCTECGVKKPSGVPQYRCDKCGWEPPDPAHPPKFCPECGDPFDGGVIKS